MRIALVLLVVLVCSAAPSNTWAEGQFNVLDNRFSIYGGARFYQADGTFSSTKHGKRTISIDMDDLGLDENAIHGIGGFAYNFSKRWNFRFDYFGYRDDGLRSAGRDFNFGDLDVPIGASIDSSLDIDLYIISLVYNIIHKDNARFGLGLGVHAIDFDLKISGKLNVGNSETHLGEGREDFLAPVPNLWALGAYALTDRVIFRYGAGWMSAGYDEYDGSLLLANAALEYWVSKNVGLAVGYHYIVADIDYESSRRKENYDVDLSGLMVYLILGF